MATQSRRGSALLRMAPTPVKKPLPISAPTPAPQAGAIPPQAAPPAQGAAPAQAASAAPAPSVFNLKPEVEIGERGGSSYDSEGNPIGGGMSLTDNQQAGKNRDGVPNAPGQVDNVGPKVGSALMGQLSEMPNMGTDTAARLESQKKNAEQATRDRVAAKLAAEKAAADKLAQEKADAADPMGAQYRQILESDAQGWQGQQAGLQAQMAGFRRSADAMNARMGGSIAGGYGNLAAQGLQQGMQTYNKAATEYGDRRRQLQLDWLGKQIDQKERSSDRLNALNVALVEAGKAPLPDSSDPEQMRAVEDKKIKDDKAALKRRKGELDKLKLAAKRLGSNPDQDARIAELEKAIARTEAYK